ncbi:hypothetical protein D5S17_10695 [Pseudonocardiaceae bacterium YIM PH 21723]|nr:hypothetical protein D5S17_10695 [Pseudonocardiaceae bacterium YIM PH 21723]
MTVIHHLLNYAPLDETPAGPHDPDLFGYSHVVTTSGELVFIAGQHSSDLTGEVTSPDLGGTSLIELPTCQSAGSTADHGQ